MIIICNSSATNGSGVIENLVHTAEVEAGNVLGAGAINTDFEGDEVYDAVVPSTAGLGTEDYLLAIPEETFYKGTETADGQTVAAGTPFKALHLREGLKFILPASVIDGTVTVGNFVIPQDGSILLAPAADLTGGTKLAFEVLSDSETIGFDKSDAVKVRVVSA